MGRAAIRAVDAHLDLKLAEVVVANPEKVGADAGVLADLGRPLGVLARADAISVLASGVDAVVYAASGDVRPDAAVADIVRCLRAGAVVVTPSVYSLYDPASAPEALRSPLQQAAKEGGGALFSAVLRVAA